MDKIRVGARGSKLSRIQAQKVINILEKKGLKTEFIPIKTEGDRDRRTPLFKMESKGVFIKALEEALIEGKIDIAVHSAKDVPTDIPQELEIVMYLERDEPNDVIICEYKSIEEIPENAKIGTSSVRRMAFLSLKRKDFEFIPLRGNVDTRIRKWKEKQFDAILLAYPAMKRMEIHEPHIMLDIYEFPPSPGQGAICVETKKDSPFYEVLRNLSHTKTEIEVRTERELLKKLGGGCAIPFGCYAEFENNRIHLFAMYMKDGKLKKADVIADSPEEAAEKAYEKLI